VDLEQRHARSADDRRVAESAGLAARFPHRHLVEELRVVDHGRFRILDGRASECPILPRSEIRLRSYPCFVIANQLHALLVRSTIRYR
jgi:hypothetical protein